MFQGYRRILISLRYPYRTVRYRLISGITPYDYLEKYFNRKANKLLNGLKSQTKTPENLTGYAEENEPGTCALTRETENEKIIDIDFSVSAFLHCARGPGNGSGNVLRASSSW